MKHVNAYPFVGKDYEKGFLNSGKKVLLLGLSHYNEENAGAPCHHTFTQEIGLRCGSPWIAHQAC